MSRVSTLVQDLEQQTEAVMRQIAADGLDGCEIVAIEDKESAVKLSEEERNGLNRLKDVVRQGGVLAVYAYEISRISRRLEVNVSMRNFLRDHHVQLIVLRPHMRVFDDDWNVSAEANVLYSIFAAMAENEGYLRKERLARGVAKAKSQGRYYGGRIAFGYRQEGKRLVVDPEKAQMVKRIYEEYAAGEVGAGAIADGLWREGMLPSEDRNARRAFVTTILKNDCYRGDAQHARILDDELMDKAANVRRKKRRSRELRSRGIYLAGNRLRANGGGRMYGRADGNSYVEDGFGSRASISADKVDTILLHAAETSARAHAKRDKEAEAERISEELRACRRRLSQYGAREAKERERIVKIEERIIFGMLPEDKAAEMEEAVKKRLKDLSAERARDERLKHDLEAAAFWLYQDQAAPEDVWHMDIGAQAKFVREETGDVFYDRVANVVEVCTKAGVLRYVLARKKRKDGWCTHEGESLPPIVRFVRG